MTISNVYEKTIAPANGVTTMFPYAYPVLRDTNVVVNLVDNTTGVETLQTLNADYVVSSTPASSVTITFNVAPASGNSVTIDQNIPVTQVDVDMTEFGKFPSEVVEEGMDKLTMLAQQNSLGVKKAIRINPTLVDFTGTTDIKENAPDRANKVIGFDATGENISLYVNSQDAYDQAIAAADAASQSASDAADSEANASQSSSDAADARDDAEAARDEAEQIAQTIGKEFPDNEFRVVGSADATKKVAIEADNLTPGVTRTLTVQDISGTVYVSGGQDVSVADGGTNISMYTTGDTIYASSPTVLSKLGIGTSGQVKGVLAGVPAWVNGPSWAYESSEQTITANNAISLSHGLGYVPRDVQVVIRNKTTEYAWAVGDEIPLSPSGIQNNTGFGYGMNSTNIYVTIPGAIWVFHRNNPSSYNAITVGNWRIVVRAR